MNKSTEAAAGRLAGSGIYTETGTLLSSRSSFHIGGPADLCVYPADAGQMAQTVNCLRGEGVRFMVAGNASNLLFDDAGYRGAVIFTGKMKEIAVRGTRLTAGAGVPLTAASAAARDASLTGLEFAYGIPGTVGGGVCMNAGAYGGQLSDVLVSCTLLDTSDGTLLTRSRSEMKLSYRHSLITERPELAVISAEFELAAGDRGLISGIMDDLMGRRRAKQPLEYPSAGSVFKRPAPDMFAGKMIEDSGLKGLTSGGAQVSEKHAGFIVNRGGATAADVKNLIGTVQDKVFENYGVRLECEVCFIPSEE